MSTIDENILISYKKERLLHMLKEVAGALPVLVALIAANIAIGTANSLVVDKIEFDKKRMLEGFIKAVAAIAGVFALAYAFDTIDLSSLGFTPMTMITAGIIAYAYKLGVNLVKILGLQGRITITDPTDPTNSTEDK